MPPAGRPLFGSASAKGSYGFSLEFLRIARVDLDAVEELVPRLLRPLEEKARAALAVVGGHVGHGDVPVQERVLGVQHPAVGVELAQVGGVVEDRVEGVDALGDLAGGND